MTKKQTEGFELPDFQEPIELQEWYDIGADIRVAIRKQFSQLKKESHKVIEAKDARIAELEDENKQLLEASESQSRQYWNMIETKDDEIQRVRDLLERAKSTVRTHAMQSLSRVSDKLADEIEEVLNQGGSNE